VPHDLRALSRRWFDEVWNQGRDQTIDELAAPDAAIHGLGEGGRQMSSPAEFRKFYHLFRSAFPDMRVEVNDVLLDVGGDKTAVRITFTGTHTGSGLGLPPTGRPFRATAIILARWRDGRMVEAWNEFDAAGMMQQLTGPAPVQLRA